jgi:hypothetical protein
MAASHYVAAGGALVLQPDLADLIAFLWPSTAANGGHIASIIAGFALMGGAALVHLAVLQWGPKLGINVNGNQGVH